MNSNSELLGQFEAFAVNPAEFGHQQHLQVAYEMIQKYGFLDAFSKYAKAISMIANKAGAPKKFNMTITLAF